MRYIQPSQLLGLAIHAKNRATMPRSRLYSSVTRLQIALNSSGLATGIGALSSGQAGRAQKGLPNDLQSAARAMGFDNLGTTLEPNPSAETLARETRAPMAAMERSIASERDLAPVTMVRKQSPYADIPSLYDLYVQAAARDKVLEPFGLALFRNGSLAPEALPMDLPVGPDYVLGPGDSLSINLWGGVAQRISRVVDREGRIALPEAGPLLEPLPIR